MTYRLIATYETNNDQRKTWTAPFTQWLCSPALDKICEIPGLLQPEIMTPAKGDVLHFNDGPGPAAMIHFTSEDLTILVEFARSDIFRTAFMDEPSQIDSIDASFDGYEIITSQIKGVAAPDMRHAALSFVIRYLSPITNADAFRDVYVENHPPILARFPDVRNVFCYLPKAIDIGDLPRTGIELGNEVVFDNLDALNNAMSSNVMTDLRADTKTFPPYNGSTHHAMSRRHGFTG